MLYKCSFHDFRTQLGKKHIMKVWTVYQKEYNVMHKEYQEHIV